MQRLYKQIFKTHLGNVCAVSSDEHVLALFFKDDALADPKWMQDYTHAQVVTSQPLECLQQELTLYFKGELQQFETPILLQGSGFELAAWKALQRIPYGETISYLEQAESMSRPKAFRAVGSANGRNRLSILVPCHRVINTGGATGGYAGGHERKQKLISLEKKWMQKGV